MYLMTPTTLLALTLLVAFVITTLYIMRRRVRQGKRTPKF